MSGEHLLGVRQGAVLGAVFKIPGGEGAEGGSCYYRWRPVGPACLWGFQGKIVGPELWCVLQNLGRRLYLGVCFL